MVWTRSQTIASTPGISLLNFWNHRLHCHWLISKIRCSIIILTTINHRCTLIYFSSLIRSWKIIMHCLVACPLPSPKLIFIFIYITKINIELWHNPAQAGKSRNTYIYLITSRIIRSFHLSAFCCLARYLAQMILV